MTFTLPQFGIFARGTPAHRFLEFDFRLGITRDQAVASFRRLRTPDVSAGGVNLVVAFGADAWRTVAPSQAPASLTDFREITGPSGRRAPATQHDAWVWISGGAPDVTWDHARTAHIARVTIDVAGEELKIFRRSVPYGTVEEHGLYFIAFSADPSRYDRMLARMFGTAGDGVHDRLIDFSRPVSGAYYFAPSIN